MYRLPWRKTENLMFAHLGIIIASRMSFENDVGRDSVFFFYCVFLLMSVDDHECSINVDDHITWVRHITTVHLPSQTGN